MNSFEITQLQQQLGQQTELYLEFLRVPALSVGLYELAAGNSENSTSLTCALSVPDRLHLV